MSTYRTFNPPQGPSYEVPLDWAWLVTKQKATKPYVKIIPELWLPVRRYSLAWKVGTPKLRDYLVSFFHRQLGPTTPFWWTPTDPTPTPEDEGPDLDSSSGGELSQRTYYVKFTWYDSTTGYETEASPAASITVAADYLLEVSCPRFPSRVGSWRIYAHETAGSECLQTTQTDRNWTEPVTGLVTGSATPPATNNLKLPALWRLEGGIQQRLIGANRYRLSLTLEEFFA